jgi:hypothetical protein
MTALTVEFSGGLEALFDNVKKQKLEIHTNPLTILGLLGHLEKMMTDSRTDLFLQDGLVYVYLVIITKHFLTV